MDWHGRVYERKVKLQLLGMTRNPCMDGHGRAHEREVKLQLARVTRNPLHGLAWSSDVERTNAK